MDIDTPTTPAPFVHKLDIHNTNVAVTAVKFEAEELGRIPDNLARMAETIIMLCRANGDIAWLADMVHEAERDGEAGTVWGEHTARTWLGDNI